MHMNSSLESSLDQEWREPVLSITGLLIVSITTSPNQGYALRKWIDTFDTIETAHDSATTHFNTIILSMKHLLT